MTDRRVVSVFGSSQARPGQEGYQIAEEVGRMLASHGFAVANGGYGGCMEAVSRGARAAGGEVIGVICGAWPTRPNAFVSEVVRTGNLCERLRTLIELGTAGYVVLPGATGTLLELAGAWELASVKTPGARPIICVGEYWRPLVTLIGRLKPSAARRVAFVGSPVELARHLPAT